MRLSSVLRKALATEDYITVGKVVDRLRFHWKMAYSEIAEWVKMHCGLSLSEWELVLQECERTDAREDTKG